MLKQRAVAPAMVQDLIHDHRRRGVAGHSAGHCSGGGCLQGIGEVNERGPRRIIPSSLFKGRGQAAGLEDNGGLLVVVARLGIARG